MKKHFLTVKDFTPDEISDILKIAAVIKKQPFSRKDVLKDKVMGMIFQKPSNRTRLSFEVGAMELGGNSVFWGPNDIQLGKREPVKDVARVFSRYVGLAVLRTFSHNDIMEFAEYSDIPVINGLSDMYHPCQALSDVFTIVEKIGDTKDKTLCYVGDGNNVMNSLLFTSSQVSMNMNIATPEGYGPDINVLNEAKAMAEKSGSVINVFSDPGKAAENADVLYTDVWSSMGKEGEHEKRKKDFMDYQINADLINRAKDSVIVMHCLPAHRGEEISDDVIESSASVVFDQAENRLHVQKAIITKLISGK